MTGWTQHLPVLPVLLPAATAIVLLGLGDQRDGAGRLCAARRIALASAALALLIALQLAAVADTDALTVYRLGDWPAPYGIVLVVDRLAALMLVLTALVALPVLLYASDGWDARGRHFHALFQFQLMGLNGAFVTGDLFNLFVFFEVLLIASYVLMLHGGGAERLRVGLHYVVLNLCASALFLIGVALVYGLTGTLNLADLALRVPRVLGPDAVLLKAAGLLLLVVFGFKAALAPLSLWLPATYAAASAPVAAMFAIMTKVGVYAILRVHGVVFGDFAAAGPAGPGGSAALLVQPLLLPLALAGCVLAGLGALAAASLPRLVAWLTVASVGTMLAAIGLFGAAAWSAALYYLANSTLIVAALFLWAELLADQRGEAAGRLEPARPVAQPALLGTLLLLAAVSAAGLPPLPGFIGKLMLLQASAGHASAALLWTVVLAVGFMTLLALARAGVLLFWNVHGDAAAGAAAAPPRRLAATVSLLAASVAMSVAAAPLLRYSDAAARQLTDREAYARAVLPGLGGPAADSALPYTGLIPATPATPAKVPR
ncbi:MAG: monovalent cation/H+ antiporter subunit D [Burkholderiaceae bacterium]|nr:monovalent cation/H+ antiporter subunit D [Burkholderiaceae bacterium]